MMKIDPSPLVKLIVVLAVAAVLFAFEQYRVARLVDAAYTSGKTDAYAKVLSDTKKLSESLSESLGAEFDKHNAYIMQSINEERIQRNEVAKLLSTGVYVDGNCHEYAGISLLNDKIRSRYIQPNAPASTK
jgi:hypothetical protein|nr:MAG TPA: hypothetical protein [Caudoviricetes sp.]